MTARLNFHLVARLKKIARPILLPLLRRIGLKASDDVEIPRISRRERLREIEVPSRVSVREDQTFLLNGMPFFPIGLYYAQDEMSDLTGAGLRKLRAMGFNTISFDGGLHTDDLLDRIWDAGLYAWCRPPGALHREFPLLKQVISKFARHPAILFWEMDDEPVFNQVNFLEAEIGCRIVRSIDPYHPILCNQWLSSLDQGEEMVKWASLADVYGFSIYPLPLWRWGKRMSLVEKGWPHSIAVVGKQIDLWKSYAPNKPIIPVLQAWAWNCLEDGEAGYPSYRECRFMAYQAVIHGAKGLHHYGATDSSRLNFAGGIPPPKDYKDLEQAHADFLKARAYNQWFWSYYSQVINEISRMRGVFAGYDADWSAEILEVSSGESDGGRIEYRVKRHLNSAVILLVNASDSHAPIELCAPELCNRTLKLWGQGRSIQANSKGSFQDTLEPYGVRIYSDQPDLLADISNPIISGDEYDDVAYPAPEKI